MAGQMLLTLAVLPFAQAAKLVSIDQSTHPTARCMDGSAPGYYVQPGAESTKFVLFVPGR